MASRRPRGSRPAGRAGCGCRTGRGTRCRRPRAAAVGAGRSTPRALSASYSAWTSSVVRKSAPTAPLDSRSRSWPAVSAVKTGSPGIAIRTTRRVGLAGRGDGEPAEAAELGRRDVLADAPAELVDVEGEGLVLIVDPELCVGEECMGEQITVAARACLLESCAPGLLVRMRVSRHMQGERRRGLRCLAVLACTLLAGCGGGDELMTIDRVGKADAPKVLKLQINASYSPQASTPSIAKGFRAAVPRLGAASTRSGGWTSTSSAAT